VEAPVEKLIIAFEARRYGSRNGPGQPAATNQVIRERDHILLVPIAVRNHFWRYVQLRYICKGQVNQCFQLHSPGPGLVAA